jgi:hypothetical protein
MAQTVKTPAKKTTAPKAAASPKKATTKKYNKGQKLACEVCGLAVAVEEIGGLVVEEDSVLLCCGKPLKAKAAAKKASATKAASAKKAAPVSKATKK